MDAGEFQISPLDRESATEIIQWRYQPPYDLYNIDPEHAEAVLSDFLNPELNYYQVRDELGNLAAFFNFGVDARVPGGDYSEEALDIGMGVHPRLTGQGKGSVFVQTVLCFARQKHGPARCRVTIAEFNQRARRVWEKAGFSQTQRFLRPLDGMSFVVLTTSQLDF